MKTKHLVYVLLVIPSIASIASASTITWGSIQYISGDTDVSLSGTFNRAYNFTGTSGSAATVHGVTFSRFLDQSLDTASFSDWNSSAFGSSSAPFKDLSADYQTLLKSSAYKVTDATITLKNLTSGKTYQIEIWLNDSRHIADVLASYSGSGTLDTNTTGLEGGLGQYVIGTFTADSSQQSVFVVKVNGAAMCNALQLREIPEPGAIPEPGTFVLLVVGSIGLLAHAWRKQR